jgi:hypothetical protein
MNERGVPMTTITIEIPDDLAAKIDLGTLPILLRELVGHKAVQVQAIDEGASLPRPLYREITDFLAENPTTQQIMAFKISMAAQERLEDLLDKNREEALSPGERAELDTYLQLSEWMTILKARARNGQLLLG